MIRLPDYADPVRGWRVWTIGTDADCPRLTSPICPCVWEPGEALEARCQTVRRSWRSPWRTQPPRHPAPALRCSCGLHAMAAPRSLSAYTLPCGGSGSVPRAIGRVALWGTVVEGTYGWRASHAYPAELWLPNADSNGAGLAEIGSIALGLTDYGVPVHICDDATPYEVVARLVR